MSSSQVASDRDADGGKGKAELEGGHPIHPEIARRLCCDGRMETVIDDNLCVMCGRCHELFHEGGRTDGDAPRPGQAGNRRSQTSSPPAGRGLRSFVCAYWAPLPSRCWRRAGRHRLAPRRRALQHLVRRSLPPASRRSSTA
jgi:hypothetical protein